ncbi:GTPase Era [Paenibacillus sp. P1XP2]|nr:GTPase Era [Paenibacillus sp. P1XP2]
MFGQDVCEISDVEACTRDPKEVVVSLGDKGIKLIDVPGVGESQKRDSEYSKLYQKLLPELDVVLWVLKADDRAYTSDLNFYKNVVLPHLDQGKPFFFVLNQSDKIEPFREWDEDAKRPGPKQAINLEAKIQSISDIFNYPSSKIIQVSANEQYNLIKLIDEIVFALPKEKQITFVNQVDEKNVSEETGEIAKDSFADTVIDTIIDFVPIPPIIKGPIRKAAKYLLNKIRGWF